MKNILIKYLWFFAQSLLKRFKPQLIAITGPAGKTSTKEMIFAVLSQSPQFKNKLGKSFGNLNTKLGIPLAIFQFRVQEPNLFTWLALIIALPIKWLFYQLKILNYPDWLILEVAADQKDDIAYLARRLHPMIAILTSVGAAHLEFFQNTARLLKEKLILFKTLPREGLAILPEKGLKRSWLDKIVARQRFFDPQDLRAAARITGEYFKLTSQQIEKGLENVRPIKGRFNVINSQRGYCVIDDTYNANPVSVETALKFLSQASREKKSQRQIVVLGDMLELGKEAKKWHRRVGRKVKKQTDLFISFGDLARYYQADIYFDKRQKLIDYLLREIKKGDIILIKGSRGMRMEKVAEALRRV